MPKSKEPAAARERVSLRTKRHSRGRLWCKGLVPLTLVVFQINREQGLFQVIHDILEESLLRDRLDSAEVPKGEAEDAVAVEVLEKRRGDMAGGADSLVERGDVARPVSEYER